MAKRKIIKIDQDKCNGCGLCIPNCPEGAIRIIDGKARLISDLFCDGLGACLGHCPQSAITIEEREAGQYCERDVMSNIVKQGTNVIKAHLQHLQAHNQKGLLKEALDYLKENNISNPLDAAPGQGAGSPCGCLGSRVMDFREGSGPAEENTAFAKRGSELRQWPVQLALVPAEAPFFKGADLLIAADCVPFSYAGFHKEFLKGKALLVGCPKLDNIEAHREKIKRIVGNNELKSVTYIHMEVPCCFGFIPVIKEAIAASGKDIPFKEINIAIKGEVKNV